MKNLKLFCETALNVNNLKEELVRDGWNMQHEHCATFVKLCDEFVDMIEQYHNDMVTTKEMNLSLIEIMSAMHEVILMIEDCYKDVANADPLIKSFKSLFDIIVEYFKQI